MISTTDQIETHGLTDEEAAYLISLKPQLDAIRASYSGNPAVPLRFGIAYIDDADLPPILPADSVYILTMHESGRHGTRTALGDIVPIEVGLSADVSCHCCKWDLNFKCIMMCCP